MEATASLRNGRPLGGPRLVALLTALAFGLPGPGLRAAEIRTVEVSAEVRGHERTPEQARLEALQRARDRAVAEVAGIAISAQQLRLKTETQAEVRDGFSYLIHTSTQGRIVRENVTYDTRLVGDVPVYRATLVADVVLEDGTRDPGFALELSTVPESHTFRDGETLSVEIRASRDCYLTVLNLTLDGQITVLFPNRYRSGNRIAAGETVRLPGRTDGFEIRASLADGARGSREHLLAIATLDRVPFALDRETEGELVPEVEREPGLTALNRWLLRIPVDRRTEVLWDYDVIE